MKAQTNVLCSCKMKARVLSSAEMDASTSYARLKAACVRAGLDSSSYSHSDSCRGTGESRAGKTRRTERREMTDRPS